MMFKRQWRTFKLILTVIPLMLGHQLYAADQIILGIVLVDIMKEITLSIFWSGLITTFFGVGILIGSMLAAYVARRKGLKFTISVGLLGFSLFTFLTGFSLCIWDLLFYRISMGIGEGIWNVAYYSVIGTFFAKKRGFANAIAGNMYLLGLLWAYPFSGIILVSSGSWRLPLHIFGLLGFFVLLLLLLTLRSDAWTTTPPQTEANSERLLFVLKNRNVNSGCLMGIFNALLFFSVAGFYPTYSMLMLGFDSFQSSVLMSVQSWLMFVTSPIILFLSDRYGRRLFLYFTSLLSAIAVYFMFNLPRGNFALAAMASLFYGVASAGGFPLLLAFVQDSVTGASIVPATSLFTVAFYIGTITAGPVTGYIISSLGWEHASLWLALCCFMWFLIAVLTKPTQTHQRLNHSETSA